MTGAALLMLPGVAMAQSDPHAGHHMTPGMTMPKPAPKPVAKVKPKPKPKAPAGHPAQHAQSVSPTLAPVRENAKSEPVPTTEPMDPTMPMAGMDMTTPAEPTKVAPGAPPAPAEAPLMHHDMPEMTGMESMSHAGHHVMKSAFGLYPGNRDASGTSWQPDLSPHYGLHGEHGGWDLMLHGTVNVVYDNQSGPRGGEKAFVLGHIMGSAARDLSARDRLQLRVAVTPDPFMGPRGYPLLFATGETADGRTQLIDRQHPHDLISELSVSLSHRFTDRLSSYLFYGEVGDPAFGPPAYIHRLSIQDDPEAPISHHWLDSMHGTQGVITGGLVLGNIKVEASTFRGREPDQHRYDIEAPKFDSFAARVSWNPTATLALQASYAFQRSPEQVTPDQNQRRYSASAIYTRSVGAIGYWSTTFAWGRRIDIEPGVSSDALDAFVLESAIHPNDRWTFFGRGERVDNDELLPAAGSFHGTVFTVGKVSAGAIRDIQLVTHLKIGLGALGSRTFVPQGLNGAYGGDRWSGEVFIRFKLD